METSISEFRNYFNNLIKINENICKRKTLIEFRDMFYYMTSLISSDKQSATTVVTGMQYKKITYASVSAFIKKRKTIPSKIFKNISDSLMDYYYNNFKIKKYKDFHIFAVDGSDTSLSKNMSNEGYKLTQNKTYCSVLMSGIYDCYNEILIDLKLSKKKDERKVFQEQLKYVNEKSIIITDRGYNSEELMKTIHRRGLKFIMRLRENLNWLDTLKETNENIVKLKQTRIYVRIIKYEHKNKYYYIATNLTTNECPIEDIKILYHRRWKIEEYFKHAKVNQSLQFFHSKSEDLIYQEIYVHKCASIISKILNSCYNNNNEIADESKYKVNYKNFSQYIVDLIYLLLYEDQKYENYIDGKSLLEFMQKHNFGKGETNLRKLFKKIHDQIKEQIDINNENNKCEHIYEIVRLVTILCETLTLIINDRHCERLRIKPPSLWYHKRPPRKKCV
jgi:hypothetical protein